LPPSNQKYPYENTKIVELIRDRISELHGLKTQREIAAEIGYDKPNVLSMYKRGEAKVPLERLPAISRALDIDPALLFKAGLEQWWPGEQTLLNQMFIERIVTKNERALIKLVATYLQADDFEITQDLLERLRRSFRE
jgi:transcriptional regulator with XRE-family HTH domain